MKLFPDKVATIVSWAEMAFGFGYTIGKIFINVCKSRCTLYRVFTVHTHSAKNESLETELEKL